MLHLILRMTRHRVAALLAVAFAVLGGSAFVTTVGVVADSGFRSHVQPGRLARADVLVTANQSFRPAGEIATALPERARVPAALVGELSRLPGVTAATGDVSVAAAAVDAHGQVVAAGDARTAGHGWASAALLGDAGTRADSTRLEGTRLDGTSPDGTSPDGTSPDGTSPDGTSPDGTSPDGTSPDATIPDATGLVGAPPAGPSDVVVGAAVASRAHVGPGDRIDVVAAGTTRTYRISGVLTASATGIYFDDATAADLAARSTGRTDVVDAVALQTADGASGAVADAVRAAVHGQGLVVSSGAARGDAEDPEAAAGRSTLPLVASSLSGVTLLVVGFLVAGALGVSIRVQRRDVALLRAVGATPRQIRTIVAGQASAVALIATVPGVALGYVLAGRFRELLVTSGMLPDALPLTYGPLPAVAAALLLVGVVQLAARGAAARTSRMPATEAVMESRSEPRAPSRGRARAGALLVAGSTVLAVAPLLSRTAAGAAGTALAGIVAAVGLALLGPLLVARVGRALSGVLPHRASAPTWLAVQNSHAYALRAGAAVSTLALVVVFTLTYALTQTTVLAATASDLHDGTTAQTTLTAPGLGGVPDGVLAAVRGVPGVLAAASVTPTTVLWPLRVAGEDDVTAYPALVLGPGVGGVLDLDVQHGSIDDLVGATIAVDDEAARNPAMTVGRTVSFVLGDGARVQARVVAVYARGLAFGPVVLSRDLAVGHAAALDQSVLVRTDGTPAAAARVAALATSLPGVVVQRSAGDGAADAGAGGGPGGLGGVPHELWINVVVLAMLLGYLLLGVATTLVASTSGRRDEIATLRLAGATPRQVRAMMRREALLVTVIATVTGVLLSVVPLMLLGLGFLGRPWAAGPGWLLPAVVAVVGGIAFISIDVPTRRALRMPTAAASAG